MTEALPLPLLLPLGDGALLVRFADELSDAANRAAGDFARLLAERRPAGIAEIDANLVSVLIRMEEGCDPRFLAGEIRLLLSTSDVATSAKPAVHRILVRFGNADGPDLEAAAVAVGLSPNAFIAAHNARPLRVLTTGFAPGFVYCGFHPPELDLPRRGALRENVPAGSLLFAAGQTALSATPIRTGWHVIGRTDFCNFDPDRMPPTQLRAGDTVIFMDAAT
jgi:KipI family sensor histidine kinase inhibitor